MSEIRIQIALHFKWDPAKDALAIPEEITKTIAIGDEITPVKVPGALISGKTAELIRSKMTELQIKAKKTAKPVTKKVEPKPAEEVGEQGSLL